VCESCADRSAIAEALTGAKRIVVTTHVRPDADAIGSAAALARSAIEAGRDATVVVPDVVPERYAFLLDGVASAEADAFADLAARADLVVVVDTCTLMQLETIADAIRGAREKAVVVDHHTTNDDVAPAIWRDTSAAAAGVMVTELIELLDWPMASETAGALAAAVLTDTGWLRHSNTDARALGVIGRLIDGGAGLQSLYRRLYQADRPERLRLLSAVLASLELHADGRLATMSLTCNDFDRTGAARDETEDFVNEPMRIGSVEVSALLVERPENIVRASFRSKGVIDVSALARSFGGGGHVEAAGCTLGGDLDSAKARVIAAITAALDA